MSRGSKEKYTEKQKRKAEHIEEGYIDRGVDKDEAEARAWATVNKQDGGGKLSGSGRKRVGGSKSGEKSETSSPERSASSAGADSKGSAQSNRSGTTRDSTESEGGAKKASSVGSPGVSGSMRSAPGSATRKVGAGRDDIKRDNVTERKSPAENKGRA